MKLQPYNFSREKLHGLLVLSFALGSLAAGATYMPKNILADRLPVTTHDSPLVVANIQDSNNRINAKNVDSPDQISILNDATNYEEDNRNLVLKDIDGNIYETVRLGQQIWIAENLKVTHFSDGTPIPKIAEWADWKDLDSPAYAWYDNQPVFKNYYGALYNWYAVETDKLCPAGWRIPTPADWEYLIEFVGENNTRIRSCRQMNSLKGGECDTDKHPRWEYNRRFGTDDYGFSALPGGFRSVTGFFTHVGHYAGWWTSAEDENDERFAWYIGVPFNYNNFYDYNSAKQMGFSVRCMKNNE